MFPLAPIWAWETQPEGTRDEVTAEAGQSLLRDTLENKPQKIFQVVEGFLFPSLGFKILRENPLRKQYGGAHLLSGDVSLGAPDLTLRTDLNLTNRTFSWHGQADK